jgi:hypothetical protein
MVDIKTKFEPGDIPHRVSPVWRKAAAAATGAEAVAIITREWGGAERYIPTLSYFVKDSPNEIIDPTE